MKRRRTMFMETTEVPADKSANGITQKLVGVGARRVSMLYDGERRIAGIDFTMVYGRLELPFSIPARIDLLFANEKFAPNLRYDTAKRRAQAERVAWRQLFRWIEAQCALIETGMVSNIEVFTPYRLTPDRKTLYEVMLEGEMKALPPAGETL